MQRLINRLIPFIMLGVALVAFAFGLIIMAYVFMIGTLVGLSIFVINWIRRKLSPPPKTPTKTRKSGRVIDSDDWRVL